MQIRRQLREIVFFLLYLSTLYPLLTLDKNLYIDLLVYKINVNKVSVQTKNQPVKNYRECYCMIVVIGGATLQTHTFGWLQVHDG